MLRGPAAKNDGRVALLLLCEWRISEWSTLYRGMTLLAGFGGICRVFYLVGDGVKGGEKSPRSGERGVAVLSIEMCFFGAISTESPIGLCLNSVRG